MGTSRRSGTGWETLSKVWDGLKDPRGGPGWVEGPSGMSKTVRRTHEEV